jgi:hypothetical protein
MRPKSAAIRAISRIPANADKKPMRIRLNDPSLIPDLLTFLERGGLVAAVESDETVSVYVPHALNDPRDHAADRLRIVSEVRGWLSSHRGARADFLQGEPPLLGVS